MDLGLAALLDMNDHDLRRLRREAALDPEAADYLSRAERRLRPRVLPQMVRRRGDRSPDPRTHAQQTIDDDYRGDIPRYIYGATGRTGWLGSPGWSYIYDPLFADR